MYVGEDVSIDGSEDEILGVVDFFFCSARRDCRRWKRQLEDNLR